MPLLNVPGIRDINLEASIALPAAGATATSPTIDTGTTTPGDAPRVFLGFYVPAASTLASGATLTFTVQDSADGITFAPLAGAPVFTVTGPSSGGSPATTQPEVDLPRAARRYLNFTVAASAGSGNVTNVTARLSVLCG